MVRVHVAEDLGGSILAIEDLGTPDLHWLVEAGGESISGDVGSHGIWYVGRHD